MSGIEFLENSGFVVGDIWEDKKEFRVQFWPDQFRQFGTPIVFEYVDEYKNPPVVKYYIKDLEKTFSIPWTSFLARIQS